MKKTQNTLKIKPFFQLSLVICIGVFITGCGEFSYKRGASAVDFQQAKHDCQQEYKGSEVDSCLKQQGWLVVSPDKPLTSEKDEAVFGQSAVPSLQGPTVDADIKMKPDYDPLEKVKINSWWKVGAGAEQLRDDSQACVEKLGKEHAPLKNYSVVTNGLLVCMHNKGWYAIRQINSP